MDRSKRRLLAFVAVLALCFLAMEVRLFHFQVVRNPDTLARAQGFYRRTEDVLAARGRILSRNGYALAESIPAVDLYADSRWTREHRDQIFAELVDTFGEPLEELRARLDLEGYRRILRRPIFDAEQVVELWSKKRAGRLPGIQLERTWVRRYPEEKLAASVIGYVDQEGKGRTGMEASLETSLRGTEGRRELLKDSAGRMLFDLDCHAEPPVPGDDVQLTIDIVLQYYAERALDDLMEAEKPVWATIVVLDPRTGATLAMASRPDFDPNQYGNYPVDHHLNRAVSFTYTPGSTFKPFIMAEALAQYAVRLDEVIDCSRLDLPGRRIQDSHPNGMLTPAGVMSESSNIGMTKIALRLVPDESYSKEVQLAGFRRVHAKLTDLGFGNSTGLGLPAEAEGLLASPRHWSRRYTLASLSFGHEIAVTPIQLAAAFCVFANGGTWLQPYLVERVVAPDGTERPRPARALRQVFDREDADTVREMLLGVVEEGTGELARIEGYSVAGKTSTAQWERDRSKYTASFVGFAPATDPRLLVAVVVDRPGGTFHSGGKVAAPYARDVLESGLAYLRVPRDRMISSSR